MKTLWTGLAKCLALLMLTATPASAISDASGSDTNRISNPAGILENFDVANLLPLVQEMGFQAEAGQFESGNDYIRAVVDGVIVVMQPMACQQLRSSCGGLSIMVYYTAANPSLAALVKYNQDRLFAKAGLTSDGFFVNRYEIADYGIPRGNVRSSVINLRRAVDNVQQMLIDAERVSDAGEALTVEQKSPSALTDRIPDIPSLYPDEQVQKFYHDAIGAGADVFNGSSPNFSNSPAGDLP